MKFERAYISREVAYGNISLFNDSPWIMASTPEEEKEAQRVKTLHKLIKYLREDPRSLSINCFRCGPIERREENREKYGYGY